ncbi:MAG: acyl-CoA thioesterase [Desulfobulbaceae bacterium]|nr:acyl-CoA thioesterase [Desulfobulbaceae bacterium]
MRQRRNRGEVPNYFEPEEGAPEPLLAKCSRRVRFEEVDPLRIAWHGRYVSYFEDGRVAFGHQYGLSYAEFMKHKVAAPIVQLHLDYLAPLTFDELFTIEAVLHWSTAMRLNFTFAIRKENNQLAATGYSVQVLTDLIGNVIFFPPDWVMQFQEKWRSGKW